MSALGNFLLISTLSLLPCALWLLYFASQSRYKQPSRRVILYTFLLGALSTLPALAVNIAGERVLSALSGRSEWTYPLILFFVVAPAEELLKLLVVYLYSYRQPEFDEPLDGVIYAAAAALGFAAVENAIFLAETGPLLLLVRGPLTNPGHALFSALWGLSLSRAKAAPNMARARLPIIARGYLLAALLHGTFDLLLLAAGRIHLLLFALVAGAVLALFFWVRSRIRFYRDSSPHREGTIMLRSITKCEACGTRGESGQTCPECGRMLPEPEELQVCPVCETRQRRDATFCVRCGANLQLPAAVSLERRPRFVAILPGGRERIAFILDQEEVAIGRTLNNEFVIEHPSVSKRHARVIAEETDFALQDLGSINGTFINGRRVQRARLEDGCEVRFGQASFVYRGGRNDER